MFKFLNSSYENVEKTKIALQHICSSHRALLKPWPSSKTCVQKLQSTDEQEKEQLKILENDCTEIKALNKLLEKAERALSLYSTNVATPEPGLNVNKERPSDVRSVKNDGTECIQGIKNVSETCGAKTRHEKRNCFMGLTQAAQSNEPSYLSTVSTLDCATSQQCDNISAPIMVDDSVGIIAQSALRRIVQSKPTVTSKRYKPAHMIAPFRTSPHRPKSKVRPLSSRSSLYRIPRQDKSNMTYSRLKTFHHRTNSSQSGMKHSVVKEEHRKICRYFSTSGDRGDTITIASPKSDDLSTHLNNVKEQKYLENVAPFEGNSNSPMVANEFTLEHDGRDIVVPRKLKQLSAKNKKLKDAISQSLQSFPESSSLKHKFVNSFYDSMPHNGVSIFRRKVDQITAGYQNLLSILEGLRMQNVSDSTSAHDLCRARVTLEFILKTFQSLNGASSQLLAEYRQVYRMTDIPKDELSHLSASYSSNNIDLLDDEPVTARSIRYRKVADVLEFWNLYHRYHVLQIERQLMDCIEDELLPSVRDHCGIERFIPLHRALYSLLCVERSSFPTFVNDDPSDEQT